MSSRRRHWTSWWPRDRTNSTKLRSSTRKVSSGAASVRETIGTIKHLDKLARYTARHGSWPDYGWGWEMPVSIPESSGGRIRAYFQFIAAVLYFFLARSLARHGAQGLAGEQWFPLLDQAILAFLLLRSEKR